MCYKLWTTLDRNCSVSLLWAWRTWSAAVMTQQHGVTDTTQVMRRVVQLVSRQEHATMVSYLVRWRVRATMLVTRGPGDGAASVAKSRFAALSIARVIERWQTSWQRYAWHALRSNADGSLASYQLLQDAAVAIAQCWKRRESLVVCRAIARWRSVVRLAQG